MKRGTKSLRTVLVALVTMVLPMALMASACSEEPSDETGPRPNQGKTPTGDGGEEAQGICLMNNCSANNQCVGCSDGRNTCLVAENRCVACDPNDGSGCAAGEYCTSFGLCAPEGLTCETDERGVPLITCTQNSDCLACSPMHQVCDTNTGQCQACTDTNTQHCLSSDICTDGECSATCPSSCTTDSDCGQCGAPGFEAHACDAHECAQCSDTYPCASGEVCQSGRCIASCGIPGPVIGECLEDADCAGCGDPERGESHTCKKPINANGPHDRGTCTPQATGCSDLGSSVAVLPAPFNAVTNLCSNDSDCNGVGVTFNVGDAIRGLIGDDEIDLGFTEIEIHDANVQYKMPVCADIELTNDISCGVCVPCEQDSDCAPIDIDPLIADIFASDPLAVIASALLFDLLWGDEDNHHLNFQCAQVAAGYGACVPCGNPLQPCGQNQGGGNQNNTCDHDVCAEGTALGASCDSCAADVCAVDAYCCNTEWDDVCVGEAQQICGACGSGSCSHSECAVGTNLVDGCNTCVTDVCAADPYCCNTEWDSVCVNAVDTICGADTCQGGGGAASCAHDECVTGDKLVSTCSSCAQSVCAEDDFCCNDTWDSLCVDLAEARPECGC